MPAPMTGLPLSGASVCVKTAVVGQRRRQVGSAGDGDGAGCDAVGAVAGLRRAALDDAGAAVDLGGVGVLAILGIVDEIVAAAVLANDAVVEGQAWRCWRRPW